MEKLKKKMADKYIHIHVQRNIAGSKKGGAKRHQLVNFYFEQYFNVTYVY